MRISAAELMGIGLLSLSASSARGEESPSSSKRALTEAWIETGLGLGVSDGVLRAGATAVAGVTVHHWLLGVGWSGNAGLRAEYSKSVDDWPGAWRLIPLLIPAPTIQATFNTFDLRTGVVGDAGPFTLSLTTGVGVSLWKDPPVSGQPPPLIQPPATSGREISIPVEATIYPKKSTTNAGLRLRADVLPFGQAGSAGRVVVMVMAVVRLRLWPHVHA